MNDVNSLSHTSWNCKYHVVFAPKYRRRVFFGEKRREIGSILRTLCNWKGIKIIEAEVCPGHIHMGGIFALVIEIVGEQRGNGKMHPRAFHL